MLLSLLVLATWLTDVTGAALIELTGKVGGEVTFHCPVDKQKTLTILYFQKGDDFVNGYYASKDASKTAWRNTRLDLNKSTVHMSNLKPSHGGDYKCIIMYSGKIQMEPDVELRLTVTANYSKPTLTVHCSDAINNFSCLVQCASHGGYPRKEVTWHVPQSLTVVNNSTTRDPDTTTFNISSTAYVNCSDGQQTSLRCSVGNVSSDIFTVCKRKHPLGHSPSVTIAAICAAGVGFCIMVALLWRCCCYKKGQRKAAAECEENGCEEEVIRLHANQGAC
ncbi:T-lymphocyte activation antigen CD80 isoform X1 [Gasterosteus aculeatus]